MILALNDNMIQDRVERVKDGRRLEAHIQSFSAAAASSSSTGYSKGSSRGQGHCQDPWPDVEGDPLPRDGWRASSVARQHGARLQSEKQGRRGLMNPAEMPPTDKQAPTTPRPRPQTYAMTTPPKKRAGDSDNKLKKKKPQGELDKNEKKESRKAHPQ